ncbi:hypothetical protein EDD16DRAFT_1823213 [Pisolithus croceorrhizus]|nr:hypothetical protein EDD16DRAFT_1823213 [Pisolithus croceorrhizus]KAI6134881.1 hypothetical protein EV401DRAFT_863422 [Pisolithus croceorrhizus]KAI6162965.1 hypothetical protein EDD17DRAFT_1476861 [Pisolithus thermaeus]
MSESARRLGEDADRAYAIQVAAGTKSAAIYGVLGLGAVALAHCTWPFFRHQTLAFKSFLVSTSAVFGLAIGADNALLSHEAERRRSENAIRRQATLELTRRGMVPTETAIAKWRAEKTQQSSANGDRMG